VVIFPARQLAAALRLMRPLGALDQGLRAARCDFALYLDADNLPRPALPRPAPSTAPAAHRENP